MSFKDHVVTGILCCLTYLALSIFSYAFDLESTVVISFCALALGIGIHIGMARRMRELVNLSKSLESLIAKLEVKTNTPHARAREILDHVTFVSQSDDTWKCELGTVKKFIDGWYYQAADLRIKMFGPFATPSAALAALALEVAKIEEPRK